MCFCFFLLQLLVRQKMAIAQETPNRTSKKAWLEGLLGMLEGHHITILSM